MVNGPHRQLPTTARRVLISVNPKAGAKSGQPIIEQLVGILRGREYDVDVLTYIEQVATESARCLANGSLRAVVAAGGDGTAGLVANQTARGVPIAVLPLGTENLLAKYLGISPHAEPVARMIAAGNTVCIDAGQADGRLFLLMLSCGFDAEVVRRLHDDRHGHIHHLSYAKPILDAIRSYEYPELKVYCLPDAGATASLVSSDGESCVEARWAFVVNLPRYAVGLSIVPEAVATDGLLDVCTFKEGSLWSGLLYLGGVLLGQHQSWSDCVTTRARRLRIESAGQVPYQLDGDPGGFLPVEIDVLPKRLTLLVPEEFVQEKPPEAAPVLCPET